MTTIRFGKSCDSCPTFHNNYDVGDIVACDDCGRDLCAPCREASSHYMVRAEICCDQCPGLLAGCA